MSASKPNNGPNTESSRKVIELPWHGDVASEVADCVGGLESLHCQTVDASRESGVSATYESPNYQDVLAAAYRALCEHHPDKIPNPAECEVVEVRGSIGESLGVVVLTGWE